MEQRLYTFDETVRLIESGNALVLAGDEHLLMALPKGTWIGGTTPYFIGETGGVISQELLYVAEIPAYALSSEIRVYDSTSVRTIYNDAPSSGFTYILIPGFTPTHSEFALHAPTFENFGATPLMGWIAGFAVQDLGKVRAKVFDGRTRTAMVDGAIAFHVELPPSKLVDLQIVNIFKQGSGDSIFFPESGFDASTACVNGIDVNFADYILERGIDTQLPLIADMYGALINTSFHSVDSITKTVTFYAPIFAGTEYKIGAPIADYGREFSSQLPVGIDEKIVYSCNCVLNFMYAGFEGKKTGAATGPIAFGEITYQLLNQTMSYMTIEDAPVI